MVAPRLPSEPERKEQKKRRLRRHPSNQVRRKASMTLDNRLWMVPLGLASLAILWNIVKLWRSLGGSANLLMSLPPKTKHASGSESSWNWEWCSGSCSFVLPLDLQEFLPAEPAESFLDMENLGNLFVLDDDAETNNKQPNNNNNNNVPTQKPNSIRPMTDDLDNHYDHFGNMIMNLDDFAAISKTPRVLVEARKNISLGLLNVSDVLKRQEGTRRRRQNSGLYALLSRKGLGGTHYFNQDRAVLVDPFPVLLSRKQKQRSHQTIENNFFMGVFDGHGYSGHVKSDHAACTLPQTLLQRLSKFNNKQYSDPQVRKAFQSVFWDVHRQGPLIQDSGCTGSVIVRLQQRLYFANTGDSRSFLIKIDPELQKFNITHMTKQHKPDDPMERQRIVSRGCVVIDPMFNDPTARVADSLDGPGLALAMSRSIGDYDLEHCGVIPEPTITVVNLDNIPPTRRLVLLAVSITDGLFDHVSLDGIAKALATPFLTPASNFDADATPLEMAAEDLIREASDSWHANTTFDPYRDDITIAVRRVQ